MRELKTTMNTNNDWFNKKEYLKEYYLNNREQQKEKSRKRYSENKEFSQEYYKEKKEHMSFSQKEYRDINKEKLMNYLQNIDKILYIKL